MERRLADCRIEALLCLLDTTPKIVEFGSVKRFIFLLGVASVSSNPNATLLSVMLQEATGI